MSIPRFTRRGFLPPYLGRSPVSREHQNPYPVSILDVVDRFATSPARVRLLRGLLTYRRRLTAAGMVDGFQWIDGSFVERDDERSPHDIDVVTFLRRPEHLRAGSVFADLLIGHPEISDQERVRAECGCDSYIVDLHPPDPIEIVDTTRYWIALFSHRRGTNEWKGLLQVPLGTLGTDSEAEAKIKSEAMP